MVFTEQDEKYLRQVLIKIRDESRARDVFLVRKTGVCLTGVFEDVENGKVDNFTSLMAGNVAASESVLGLVNTMKEKKLANLHIDVGDYGIYSVVVNKDYFLIVIYHKGSTVLATVKFVVSKFLKDLRKKLEEIDGRDVGEVAKDVGLSDLELNVDDLF